MRTLFVHQDGRLKTGRLSLALFIVLLLGLSALFYLRKPVDEAVVVVRHIFTAPVPPAETPPRKPDTVAEPVPPTPAAKVVKAAKPVGKKVAESAGKQQRKAAPDPAEPAPAGRPEKKMLAESENGSRPVAEVGSAASQAAAKPEIAAPEAEKAEPVPPRKKVAGTVTKAVESEKKAALEETAGRQGEAPGNRLAGSERIQNGMAPGEKEVSPAVAESRGPLPEESVVDLQKKWQPVAHPVKRAAAVHLMSPAARQRLAADYSRAGGETRPAMKKKVSLAARIGTVGDEKSVKSAVRKTSRLEVAVPGTAKSLDGDQPAAVTVGKSEYLELHRAWRKTGDGDKANDRLIPLRIENLRSAYRYLQMKPVLIRADGSCVDLNDGSRIPPQSLDRFSATVIRVVDPWQKWGEELRRAGLGRGEKFEVRYYLYDFVRRSVYTRANQAYDWARNRGLLDPATKPADIDILGRAYVVRREGGGSFGVFVPLRFTTRDGRTVRIDPQAFNHSPDILALRRAGLI